MPENPFRLIEQLISPTLDNQFKYSLAMNPREADSEAKKEGNPNCSNISKMPSSSRHWSSHKNPRIVRVSRCFGGKDRHSKVCTVKGLRDRRIRLSVPTAIQLYDLQNKLGLSQPSKVVDWLLNATKCDIDELPPLPKLPINFTHLTHPPSHFLSSNHPYTDNNSVITSPTKVDDQTSMEKVKWNASHNHQEAAFGGYTAQLSAQNFFPLSNQSAFLNNIPSNPYFHLDPSSLPFFPNQTLDEDHQPHNNLLTSVLPLTSHLYFCPSAATVPSLIPSSKSNESRHINHLSQNVFPPTTLNLNTPPMTTFPLMTVNNAPKVLNDCGRSVKDNQKVSSL